MNVTRNSFYAMRAFSFLRILIHDIIRKCTSVFNAIDLLVSLSLRF